jgi:hypothetical protein
LDAPNTMTKLPGSQWTFIKFKTTVSMLKPLKNYQKKININKQDLYNGFILFVLTYLAATKRLSPFKTSRSIWFSYSNIVAVIKGTLQGKYQLMSIKKTICMAFQFLPLLLPENITKIKLLILL